MSVEQQKQQQEKASPPANGKSVFKGKISMRKKSSVKTMASASQDSHRTAAQKPFVAGNAAVSGGDAALRSPAKKAVPAVPGQDRKRRAVTAQPARRVAASATVRNRPAHPQAQLAKVASTPDSRQSQRQQQPGQKDTAQSGTRKKDIAGIFMRIAPKNRDIITDIRAAILAQSPRGGRWIIWLTLAFVIAFFIWAAVSELEEITRASGKVVPSSQIQVVQNLEGGILSGLNIRVGDVVQKNQVLLKIDKTRFTASYNESRAAFLALTAKVARLEAEVQGKDFVVPKVVQKENPKIGQREARLYASRMEALENSKQILEEQLAQRKQELAELKGKINELNRTNELLKKEISITQPLVAQGAVSEVDILRLKRQSSEMWGSIQAARLALPKIRSQINEAKKALADETLKHINQSREELNKAHTDLESVSASSVALADRLQRTEVRSPVKGTVNRILVNTVGGIIQPGMDLVEIVPLEDSLLIEARIKPADIAFLRPDQKAKVKFSAYDFTIYGGLDAKLEQISADSLTDEQGNDYYLIQLRTQKNYLGSERDPLPIIPGMLVSVDIISGKKTVLSYLLKPMLRAKYLALRER